MFESFLEDTQAASSKKDIFSTYEEFLETLGYDQVLYSAFTRERDGYRPSIHFNKNLHEWEKHYLESEYLRHDIVFRQCAQTPGAFEWAEYAQRRDLSKVQKRVFEDAESAGLLGGVAVGIHGNQKLDCSVMLASSQKIKFLAPVNKSLINLATYHVYLRVSPLLKELAPGVESLTSKEQDVLRWFASGLSRCEMADKMNLSSHTIDYYYRKIVNKMRARNMASALVIAIHQNAVSLS